MIGTGRLEAFSDGVIAIIITIMVLELSVPHEASLAALQPLIPVFLSYILSFIYVGIYWNNHHHMLEVTETVSGGVLWANLHLLFWLSLVPFVTAWMGESNFAAMPLALYGVVMLMAAVAWWILEKTMLSQQNQNELLREAIKGTYKEIVSPILYIAAILLAFVEPLISGILYAGVALMWLIPDRRMVRVLSKKRGQSEGNM